MAKNGAAQAAPAAPLPTALRIGYVVREALDALHNAIDHHKILKVEFDYVKFVVQFKQRGWYAGISITINGEWPANILRC